MHIHFYFVKAFACGDEIFVVTKVVNKSVDNYQSIIRMLA